MLLSTLIEYRRRVQQCRQRPRIFLQQNQVDVVFLDIQMPKENGISLARSISTMDNPPAYHLCDLTMLTRWML